MKKASKSPQPGSKQTVGSTTSFEQLVHTFGSPDVKAKLLNNG